MTEHELDVDIDVDAEAYDRVFGAKSADLSFDEWVKSTILDFLDIANLPTSNERHNAIVALNLGEGVHKKFKLIEAYLSVREAYGATLADGDSEKEQIGVFRSEVAILKRQIGL